MQRLINAIGIQNDHTVKVIRNNGDLKSSHFDISGNSNLLQNLNDPNTQAARLLFGGAEQNLKVNVPSDVIIFNSICNADKSSNALLQLSDFIQQLSLSVINHPESILETTRDIVAQKLASIEGVIVPKCIKITPDSVQSIRDTIENEKLSFPLIFRTAGDQGSQNMVKIDSVDRLSESLEAFAITGENSFYLIEYIDYRSPDGFYRKARFWVVGEAVIPRHLVVSTSWNISYDIKREMMAEKPEWQEEEKQFIRADHPDSSRIALEMKKALALDYFGIDCAFDEDGKMILFEATPCMAVREDSDFPYVNEVIPKISQALKQLIRTKASEVV